VDYYIKEICDLGLVSGMCFVLKLILDLMRNNYGNYVVQSALKLSKNNSKSILVDNMYQNMDKMNDMKLIHKWKGIIEESLGYRDQTNSRSGKKSVSHKVNQSNDSKDDIRTKRQMRNKANSNKPDQQELLYQEFSTMSLEKRYRK
jgi:hypothetical protein